MELFSKDKVPKIMIERAVELWCRELKKPKFDNGDDSPDGLIASALFSIVRKKHTSNINNMDERIELFRTILTSKLFELRSKNEYFQRLSVDYGPETLLRDASEKAGIPVSQFSMKSSIYIEHKRICSRFGYSGDTLNHYPLSNERWLVTTLMGTDIDKVIDSVDNGNPLGLSIEGEL
jgi:hypothetical protein